MNGFQATIFKQGDSTLFRFLGIDQQPADCTLDRLFIFNIRDLIVLLVLNIKIFRGMFSLSPGA